MQEAKEPGKGLIFMNIDVLIDTNILVYAYDVQSGPKQLLALDLLDHWIRTKRASVSTQVLSEFAVVTANKINPPLTNQQLLTSIDRISRSCKVLPITHFIVREAVRGMQTYQMSYWDAQVWAVAHLNQVPLILTEDIPSQSFIEGVRYKNPFESLA